MLTQKAFQYSMKIFTKYDDSTLEIGPTQLQSVMESLLKSPFLSENRSPIPYGFCVGTKAIQWDVNKA